MHLEALCCIYEYSLRSLIAKNRSIAADQCCKTILEIMTAAENEDVKDIQAKYLPLLRESKLLKSHIADLNHKQYDLSDIDNYSKFFSYH